MLNDPGREIYDVIRYFGSRKKIFNVHFRNIRGHRDDFQEVYPDEGDIDFVKALQVYIEVGYPYLLMPDHVPVAANDPGGLQSFAYCYGYIRALLQAVGQGVKLAVRFAEQLALAINASAGEDAFTARRHLDWKYNVHYWRS